MEKIKVEKTFKKLKNGTVEAVTIESGKEVFLPYGKSKIKIGVQNQTTTNIIDVKEVGTVLKFLDNQVESAKGQIDSFETQLNNLESVNEELMPDNFMTEVKTFLNKKNKSKKLKNALFVLNDYVGKAFQKKGIHIAIKKLRVNLKDAEEERELLRNAI